MDISEEILRIIGQLEDVLAEFKHEEAVMCFQSGLGWDLLQ